MQECNRSQLQNINKQLSQSLFQLKRSNSSTQVSIQVDFSCINLSSSPRMNSVHPIFNQDGLFYTPAFLLAIDQQKYKESHELYLNLHNRKTNQIAEQKIELFVPKPSKNNSFCCICKMPFEDYLTHQTTPKHQALLKTNQYRPFITQLCNKFTQNLSNNKKQNNQTKKLILNKSKPIKKVLLPTKLSRRQTSQSTHFIERPNLI